MRAFKKGEVMLMRKLGKLDMRPIEDPEAAAAAATATDQGLTEVFTGPVEKEYFAALRDTFPSAHALSDAGHMVAARQVNNAGSMC
jgi:hypothetical protein